MRLLTSPIWYLTGIIILLTPFIYSCSDSPENNYIYIPANFDGKYINEYGSIEIKQLNDTLVQTVFENNKGDVFDTLMTINWDFKLIPSDGTYPFLNFYMGGIEIKKDYVCVHEFCSFAYLPQFIQIEEVYLRPFYKAGKKIQIEGDLIMGKGTTINGMWILDRVKAPSDKYVRVTGKVKKEKYPIEYYSTDESPQGMFGDTSVVHYRLILEDVHISTIPKQKFKGKAINDRGAPAFIYEFSDSEIFYLDAGMFWTDEQLNKEIEIEAVLSQPLYGRSVLKNMKIIN